MHYTDATLKEISIERSGKESYRGTRTESGKATERTFYADSKLAWYQPS